MKLEKCPVCTAKMKEQNGRMICPQCGYYQIIDTSNPAPLSGQPTIPGQTGSPYPSSAQSQTGSGQTGSFNRPTGQPTGAGQTGSFNRPTGQQARPQTGPAPTVYPQRNITVSARRGGGGVSVGIIAGVATLVIISFAFLFIAFLAVSSINDVNSSPTASQIYEEESENIVENPSMPQSESFQTLVSQIFEKDFEEITPDELRKIEELDFYYDEDNQKCISCYLNDGTEHHYFLNEELYMDFADLSCFPGIIHLSLEYGYLDSGDLRGMESLVSIASEMTPAELANAVPYPQNMESIQIYSTIFASSCDGIENFPNLKYFYIDSSNLTDISALSNVPNLEQLSLTDCDSLTDYAPLYDLTKMQYLSIEYSALKDIGFVKNMPDLCWLSIEGADELISIESLDACRENLTSLFLEDTWGLHDLNVVENLTNLTQLELYLTSHEDTLPSFAAMEQLEYLRLYGAHDLSTIADAKTLTYLSLENCNCENLSFLSELQNLVSLDLCDMSGYYVSFDPILDLPNLSVLDISDSTAYVDATPLLGIPTLEELYMSDCNIGFQIDAVPANENLLFLDMNNVSLYPVGNGYGALHDEEKISISQHTDIFANFPNLQCLRLSSSQLDDLSFVVDDGLSQLQMLDITDNYVTDLSPLAQLSELWYVKCLDNPIAETAGLDDILIR